MPAPETKNWFPWVSSPLIINAPMAVVTNAALATEVSRAGGIGFIQGGRDFNPDSPALADLDRQLVLARKLFKSEADPGAPLPIGVGFVTFTNSASKFKHTVIPIIQRHRPAVVWLFAPSPLAPTTLADMITALQAVGQDWSLKVAVQVGSVEAARTAVRDGANIIVAQGGDAGGHSWRTGAGVISILPEVADMLNTEFPGRQIGLWAAGGISDGRGVAAALALGAHGIAVGTKYIVATESTALDHTKEVVLKTTDGGLNTDKSQLHDHIQSYREWPDMYHGRAVLCPTYHDDKAGISLEDNIARFQSAQQSGDHSRNVVWAGTGIGLVKSRQPAGQMTRELRREAIQVLIEKGRYASSLVGSMRVQSML